MMNDTYLFLFGGNPSQSEGSKTFAKQAGKEHAKIALLIIYREGWQDYLARYTEQWIKSGVNPENIEVIIPDQDGKLNYEAATWIIEAATGIFIGGGHTQTYHSLYTKEPFKRLIQAKYKKGTPVAGNSAGALLTTQTMLLSPYDTDSGEPIILNGLGLISNILVSVHYTKWNDADNFKKGLLKTGITTGYGIDDNACLVFKNNKVHSYLGEEHVYHIK
ncbi:Type 1 glutamine amidotransferase-like domain-containing protein [Aquibacillus saliphilus]|uniref:Type 1 glutamine amidotransferase-like domain-containing protein n=1 Tax=Aquibacillus saliphilus TaxID=1909422 RepID=UPI001CF0196B|nr:Type 1 glutamine amidotransferase-like domain-containing protein [Aquibacillus saliphilus]